MRRPALYSSSPWSAPSASAGGLPADSNSPPALPATAPVPKPRLHLSLERWALLVLLLLAASLLMVLAGRGGNTRTLTQKDIDAAVLKTLETVTLPSPASRAQAAVAPSVVRVTAWTAGKPDKDGTPVDDVENGVGTGVVIVDTGVILTSLHVVAGATRVELTFHDGLQATASLIGAQPENDMAVLQAHKIPDDLQAATLRSTADLQSGDAVVAVGFPFGIGPSTSAGVVSGLGRTFRSPFTKTEMNKLIQFDAAANPGNSGGPLVTMDGEVVGIVTAILNPSEQRTFIGIGFAVPIEAAASAVGMPPF